MADKKISQLTAASSVNGVDIFPIVQSGSTLQLSFATLLANLPAQPINITAQESPASGALSTSLLYSEVTSSTGVTNYTLAAGTHGTQKYIAVATLGASASAVVTITNGIGVTTLTFNAVGQLVHLINIGGSWFVAGVHGATVA